MAPTGGSTLDRLYYHITLPRDVPGREDGNLGVIEKDLLSRLTQAASQILHHTPPQHQQHVEGLRNSLVVCSRLNVEGVIPQLRLASALSDLDAETMLIVHVTAQNCAILIYKTENDTQIAFEAFETSAASKQVLASRNALLWDFPGRVVVVPSETVDELSFQESFSKFIEQASTEIILRFAVTTLKAAAPLPELRDSSDPDLISDLLMSILEANGKVVSTSLLRKRVRDTVSFERAHRPWRRSPFYLTLRVAIQRYLYQKLGPELGRLYFKLIICQMLSQFIEDICYRLPPVAVHFTNQKLGRRLAKLTVDAANMPIADTQAFMKTFQCFEPSFEATLHNTQAHLIKLWDIHKRRYTRRIPCLRSQVNDQECILRLQNSGSALMSILNLRPTQNFFNTCSPSAYLRQYEQSVGSFKPYMKAIQPYVSNVSYVENVVLPAKAAQPPRGTHFHTLGEAIVKFSHHLALVSSNSHPDQFSSLLLHMMEMWILMDKEAIGLFPLLKDYHPGFDPDILDPIQLLKKDDMQRVHEVQVYLAARCYRHSSRRSLTIFDDPSDECFAARYYDDLQLSEELLQLRWSIEDDAARTLSDKKNEWEEKRKQHGELIQQRDEHKCTSDIMMDQFGNTQNRRCSCEWHKLNRKAKVLRIAVHEHPLPSFEPAAKATLFELRCPPGFAVYRDATWRILSGICYTSFQRPDRISLMGEYAQLRAHANDTSSQVTLGSVKKSFLATHYSEWRFPVDISEICYTCGLKPRYYDQTMKCWTSDLGKASLWHHFPVAIPKTSPYHALQPNYADWPSSNDIQASQVMCPANCSLPEFQAWQGILIGTWSRWLDLLRQLGSNNINFSTESTWVLVQRAVLHVGPSTAHEGPLKCKIHSALEDVSLQEALLEQLTQRIESIRRNWREPVQMDTYITILLKMLSKSPNNVVNAMNTDILRLIRAITSVWRDELQPTIFDGSAMSHFVIWASILCKRTLHQEQHLFQDHADLIQYISSSIIIHYSLSADLKTLTDTLRSNIIRDAVFAFECRSRVEEAILTNPKAFITAIEKFWQLPNDPTLQTRLQNVPDSEWIMLSINSSCGNILHSIHYNVVLGTLLIDGQEMSALPLAYRSHPLYYKILGTRNPIVVRSSLYGMTFMISEPVKCHRIHLGFRGDELIIRAFFEGQTLELIPQNLFNTPTQSDLPAQLVDGCYHWLNIYTGDLEIRRTDVWASRPEHWWLKGIRTGVCRAVRCYATPKEVFLIEPASRIASTIYNIFQDFESKNHILGCVLPNRKVKFELPRLELSFEINERGLLYSPRLRAVISRTQDAGTWTGLKSMIVVQANNNYLQRSILIPFGTCRLEKEGQHVKVCIDRSLENVTYLTYNINTVLGRLECAPEPKLLYIKALLHAYTSHFLVDELTQRTGTEEAIRLLQTGAFMPWAPLIEANIDTLKLIANLSPVRGHYPVEMRLMETVEWHPVLPIATQDDRYGGLVARILRRSFEISQFASQECSQPDEIIIDHHQVARAFSRTHHLKVKEDTAYTSRDHGTSSICQSNVRQIISMLHDWKCPSMHRLNILSLLQDAPVVGGYNKIFQKFLINDLLTIDLRTEWGALSQKLVHSRREDRYQLMFLLGPLAFPEGNNLDLLCTLVMFAILPDFKDIQPLDYPAFFHFRADPAPSLTYMISLMERAHIPFSSIGYKKRAQEIKAQVVHERGTQNDSEALALSIRQLWPVATIDRQKLAVVSSAFLDVEAAIEAISPEWERLTHNHELAVYLGKLQAVIDQHIGEIEAPLELNVSGKQLSQHIFPQRSRDDDDLLLSQLLQRNIISKYGSGNQEKLFSISKIPDIVSGLGSKHHDYGSFCGANHAPAGHWTVAPSQGIIELRRLAKLCKNSESSIQLRYAKELEASITALEERMSGQRVVSPSTNIKIYENDVTSAQNTVDNVIREIHFLIRNAYPQAKWLELVDLWPRMTITDLLINLRSTLDTTISEGSKSGLTHLGITVTNLQRLLRIQDAQKRYKAQQEKDEWENTGHTNWDPFTYPDWLLLEVDSDILVRKEQVEVALATIAPSSGENSVIQLLMGKGKTSCILPMVLAVIANRKDLARVVVPRPLLLQSAQVIQAKLGGMINREIIHLPFSRKTPTDPPTLRLYGQLLSSAKKCNTIVLALPEHVLSFKLSSLQQLSEGRLESATTMMNTQRWLDKYARDVLDECDVSLAIKTQLVYPSGSHMTVDGHPMRWVMPQLLLHLVKDLAPSVQGRYPRSLETVRRNQDGFPILYFLRKDAEDYLITLLVTNICNGQASSILSCAEYPSAIVEDVRKYISMPNLRNQAVTRLEEFFRGKRQLLKTLQLLRGLFVHRILLAALKKRWNVQYGLHPTRIPIAVPYSAKGSPSPSSEWGHPDIAIALTCLSFYYQGLTIPQFRQTLEHLAKMDDAGTEYIKWFPKDIDIPRELEDYTSINTDDTYQLELLYKIVRFSAPLIDLYLNSFVFPKYAKTFKHKLQASGWDLFPSTSDGKRSCRVTGFSGTNDSRHQLPMLIKQDELPHLAHTNAEVLYYLLEPRNKGYVRMSNSAGLRWSELDLIKNLAKTHQPPRFRAMSETPTRILIDAGAQVLEHSNLAFVQAWLREDTNAAAAVYFDDTHRALVCYRTGRQIPLLASPFADDLHNCIVYLDESHCRGTDIRFHPYAKAALTLGMNLSKDALVQAAMRLRLLGQTQSVIFHAPPEVHHSILDRIKQDDQYMPTSTDVLHWVIGQTCDALEEQDVSYFAQTSQYLGQEQARRQYVDYLGDEDARANFISVVQTAESSTLKQLYQPRSQRHTVVKKAVDWDIALQPYVKELEERKKRFQDRGTAVHASALEEVEIEQEREVEVEVEVEVENIREPERPERFTALETLKLHEDIEHFAKIGILIPGSDALHPVFSVLKRTDLGRKHKVSPSMNNKLWMSTQFNRTVELCGVHSDNYIRPVHWIVYSRNSERALLVSPEEADALIPILRREITNNKEHSVHLIVYAAPVTRRMLAFNGLKFHATPPLPADFSAPLWLKVELGIFAGRLYFEWDEYNDLLGYIGLNRDLSADPDKRAFSNKPLTFLREWLALRCNGQDFEHTPMGFIVAGKPLTEHHPFFRALSCNGDTDNRPQVARLTASHGDDGQEEDIDVGQDEDDFVHNAQPMDRPEHESEEDIGSGDSGDRSSSESEESSFEDALEDIKV